MKKAIKNAYALVSIFMFIMILNFFLPNIFSDFKYLLFIIAFAIIIKIIYGIGFIINAKDKNIIRSILICIFSYYLITYLLGLITGFNKSIYSYSLQNLIKNILPGIILILLVEFSRYELIKKTDKNKIIIFLSTIMFILFEVSINFNVYNFSIKEHVYQFFGLLLIPSISKNLLMTLLAYKSDAYPGITYRLLMEIVPFLIPIVPSLGYYIYSIIYILFPCLICVIIIKNDKLVKIRKPNDKSNKIYVPVLIILFILVLLNSGLIKYQIMVIGSGSMEKYLYRGDAIIINRLNSIEKRNVKKGEILVYKYNNKLVSHRVVEIRKIKNQIYYKTKGDNNKEEDKIVIDKEKIIGKVALRIKYLGKPSVWLSDLFKG